MLLAAVIIPFLAIALSTVWNVTMPFNVSTSSNATETIMINGTGVHKCDLQRCNPLDLSTNSSQQLARILGLAQWQLVS